MLNLEELIYGIHSIWRVSTLEIYKYTMSTLLSSSFGYLCLKVNNVLIFNSCLVCYTQPG